MLLLASWYVSLLALLFVFICLLMMGVILIQKPRGGGLSGAFGGAGGSAQSAFGAKTGDFLTWLTVGLFVAFLLLAILLTWTIQPSTVVPIPVISSTPATPMGAGTPPATPSEETPRTHTTPATAPGSGGGKP